MTSTRAERVFRIAHRRDTDRLIGNVRRRGWFGGRWHRGFRSLRGFFGCHHVLRWLELPLLEPRKHRESIDVRSTVALEVGRRVRVHFCRPSGSRAVPSGVGSRTGRDGRGRRHGRRARSARLAHSTVALESRGLWHAKDLLERRAPDGVDHCLSEFTDQTFEHNLGREASGHGRVLFYLTNENVPSFTA
jgi:hypothetical protein